MIYPYTHHLSQIHLQSKIKQIRRRSISITHISSFRKLPPYFSKPLLSSKFKKETHKFFQFLPVKVDSSSESEEEAPPQHLELNDDGGNDSGFESDLSSGEASSIESSQDDLFGEINEEITLRHKESVKQDLLKPNPTKEDIAEVVHEELQSYEDDEANEDDEKALGLESGLELDFESEDEDGDIGKQSKAIDKVRDSIGFFSKPTSFSQICKPSLRDNFVSKPDTPYIYEKGVFVSCDITARGLEGDLFTGTSLVNMFWKLGHLDTARKVFDKMPNKDVAAGSEIQQTSKDKQVHQQNKGSLTDANVVTEDKQMLSSEKEVNTMEDVDSEVKDAEKEVHELPKTQDVSIKSRLDTALQMFDKMCQENGFTLDVSLHEVIIGGLYENKISGRALSLLSEMKEYGVKPDIGIIMNLISSFSDDNSMIFKLLKEILVGEDDQNTPLLIYNSLLTCYMKDLCNHGRVMEAWEIPIDPKPPDKVVTTLTLIKRMQQLFYDYRSRHEKSLLVIVSLPLIESLPPKPTYWGSVITIGKSITYFESNTVAAILRILNECAHGDSKGYCTETLDWHGYGVIYATSQSNATLAPETTPRAIDLEKVLKICVMASSSPFDKLLMVQCLKEKGHVVAVTGDGTNEFMVLILWNSNFCHDHPWNYVINMLKSVNPVSKYATVTSWKHRRLGENVVKCIYKDDCWKLPQISKSFLFKQWDPGVVLEP